jgi:L,D-peptidoglycan transpeptidase YkuD (ErfK/YbiS/YcfS/YnhG family)
MLLWVVKQEPKKAGIGKWFCIAAKTRRRWQITDRNISLRKIILAKKQFNTLMENQQTTAEDKWIDDPNSDQYNTYVKGATDAKSYENLLLKNDAYKHCMVIEYNTNPIVKGKGSAIFFHLGVKNLILPLVVLLLMKII